MGFSYLLISNPPPLFFLFEESFGFCLLILSIVCRLPLQLWYGDLGYLNTTVHVHTYS
jgi:hypothetical protein